MWTGSFINAIYADYNSLTLIKGMGVTELLWTDRHRWEIIDVQDDRHITIRRLTAERVDNNGMGDMQEYAYISDTSNPVIKLFKDQKGHWRQRVGRNGLGSTIFSVGRAEEYYDYSF